jgi:Fe2+ or Zn2+ uptake regulation protein
LIREVDTRGVSRFEGKIKSHHHLICKSCGKISDFESKELIEFALQLINSQKEFEISATETNFYGLCGICKTK